MATVRVLAFAGSLRKDSYNRRLLVASQNLMPEGMEIEIFPLDGIPLYNMDVEPEFPRTVVDFKSKIKAADGLLIASPEHNFSFSGVLKNALDWASRPLSDGVLDNRPVILQSASPGWAGGIRGQMQLRQVLGYFPMRQMYFPEVFVGNCRDKFDAEGNLTDELARSNITKQLAAFKAFIEDRE